MEECDPMLDCSLKFKHFTSTAFAPYAKMLKDLRQKAKQTRLTQLSSRFWEGGSCQLQEVMGDIYLMLNCQMWTCCPLTLPQNKFHLLLPWFSRGNQGLTTLCAATITHSAVRSTVRF